LRCGDFVHAVIFVLPVICDFGRVYKKCKSKTRKYLDKDKHIFKYENKERKRDMEQNILQKLPDGFSERLEQILAEGIARSIVEKSIRNIHNRKSTSDTVVESEETKSEIKS